MLAKLSLMGLYHFDHTLFDSMPLPDGIDRKTLITLILSESAEFAVQYPDAQLCKCLLEAFGQRNISRWTKLYQTTVINYNPIENYDRNEESADQHTGSSSGGSTDTTDNTALTTGYNSETLTISGGNTGSLDTSQQEQHTDEMTHKSRIHGNIGVTTTQQMLESERELLKFNIYEQIADDLIHEFCVCIY